MLILWASVAWAGSSVGDPRAAPASGAHTRVESAIYGTFGQFGVATNETDSAFDERSVGVGAEAALALRPFRDSEPVGPVLLFGATSEYRALRVIFCGFICVDGQDHFTGGSMLGARLGLGYESEYVGVRAGLLVQGGSVGLAETMWLPDVALRLGPRDRVNLSLGVGAYDVPTTVRPGLYAGLAFGPVRGFTLELHYGLHCTLGDCGETVLQLDPRPDLKLAYALSPKLRASLGGAIEFTRYDHDVYEGRAGLAVDF